MKKIKIFSLLLMLTMCFSITNVKAFTEEDLGGGYLEHHDKFIVEYDANENVVNTDLYGIENLEESSYTISYQFIQIADMNAKESDLPAPSLNLSDWSNINKVDLDSIPKGIERDYIVWVKLSVVNGSVTSNGYNYATFTVEGTGEVPIDSIEDELLNRWTLEYKGSKTSQFSFSCSDYDACSGFRLYYQYVKKDKYNSPFFGVLEDDSSTNEVLATALTGLTENFDWTGIDHWDDSDVASVALPVPEKQVTDFGGKYVLVVSMYPNSTTAPGPFTFYHVFEPENTSEENPGTGDNIIFVGLALVGLAGLIVVSYKKVRA